MYILLQYKLNSKGFKTSLLYVVVNNVLILLDRVIFVRCFSGIIYLFPEIVHLFFGLKNSAKLQNTFKHLFVLVFFHRKYLGWKISKN